MNAIKQQATKAKYRPVLTAPQILHILNLAKSEVPLSDISYSIISTLASFQAKIENNGINPAYTAKPQKVSTLESLGGVIPNSTDGLEYTKEQYWASCYSKFCIDPISCSLEEISAATEHKYVNDLMTAEEIEVFESIPFPFNKKEDK